jgi:hypothetical protein
MFNVQSTEAGNDITSTPQASSCTIIGQVDFVMLFIAVYRSYYLHPIHHLHPLATTRSRPDNIVHPQQKLFHRQ